MEDEAERLLHEAPMPPLGMMKAAVLLLFSTSMHPEEVFALRVGSFAGGGEDDAQVRIVAALRDGRIEGYTKSDSSMRTVPLDSYTASVVRLWIEEKRRLLAEAGLVLRDSTPILRRAGAPWSHNSFRHDWRRWVEKIDFGGMRPLRAALYVRND